MGVGSPLDDIDILVAELADDSDDAGAFHADACSDRVNPVVIRLYGNFRPLPRDTHNLLDGDETVVNLRNLSLEEFRKELVGNARKRDNRSRVPHLHGLDDGLHGVTLLEVLARNLLHLRKFQFIALVVKENNLLSPGLMNLSGEELSDHILIFIIKIGLLEVHDSTLKILPDIEDTPAAEVLHLDFLREGLAYLVVVAVGVHLLKRNLLVRILHILDDFPVPINLAVSLVDVDDDVEVVSIAIDLGNLGSEHVLKHTHHRWAVNVLLILKFRKSVLQFNLFHIIYILILLLKINVRTDIVQLIIPEAVAMLHEFLFLLALDGFAQRIFQRHSVFVRPDKFSNELSSTLKRRFHLRPHGLPILFQHLERLIKPGRGHRQRIVLNRPVEAFLKPAATFESSDSITISTSLSFETFISTMKHFRATMASPTASIISEIFISTNLMSSEHEKRELDVPFLSHGGKGRKNVLPLQIFLKQD